ncbi:Two-component signal transduction system YycFG, regulatory protein YycH [Granulicatella balaenopterae]|uniref:Two-component signal transduction system YycFG, regulatory protein YycH n=1 Tax=Granulicatella balaenopterae TaxID=137733 RepID=A0A1H9M8M6_9LACT|nr:two-component system activity regulator YycH [Granulicatella balaenopterae]SER20048.1 Two-component signal transduction system YycFG, regulatory protein YycH [Granulicatella balaenopterae]
MKFRRMVLPILLAILVISSITLSSLIVFRPISIFSHNEFIKNQPNTTNDLLVTNKTLNAESVFMPSFYITYVNDGMSYTADPDILTTINSNMSNVFDDLYLGPVLDQYAYEQLVFKGSTAELLFDAPIPFGVVARYFKDIPEELTNEVFTRIIFSKDSSHLVYFLNDSTRQLYEASSTLTDAGWFDSFYDENKFVNIQSYVTKDGLTFIPSEEVTIPKEVYLVEQSPTSYFIGELFGDTNELRDRSDGSAIVYNDTLSQLKIDRTTRLLTYFRNQPDMEALEMTKSLQQSFYEVRTFEDWDLGLRYSGYDGDKNTVDFTRYVKNLPILGSGGVGNLTISVTKDGISEMRLSTLVAKTLIHKREEMMTLTSGKDIVAILLSKGVELQQIESIRIGYEWQASEESNRLAVFVPKWFVKVDGYWHNVESFISELSTKAPDITEESTSGGAEDGL